SAVAAPARRLGGSKRPLPAVLPQDCPVWSRGGCGGFHERFSAGRRSPHRSSRAGKRRLAGNGQLVIRTLERDERHGDGRATHVATTGPDKACSSGSLS